MILVSNQNNATFRKTTPAMADPMLPLPGLSPVAGKNVVVKFDGGWLSSDGGDFCLEIEGRLRIAERIEDTLKYCQLRDSASTGNSIQGASVRSTRKSRLLTRRSG